MSEPDWADATALRAYCQFDLAGKATLISEADFAEVVGAALRKAVADRDELINWILDNPWCQPSETADGEWIVQRYVGRTIARGKTKLDAVIAATTREFIRKAIRERK